MICEIFFSPNSPIFRKNRRKKRRRWRKLSNAKLYASSIFRKVMKKKEEDGENCQMQSVSLFKETQKVNVKMINGFQIKIKYIRISQTSFVLVWCLLHF